MALFEQRQLAVIANVGVLSRPSTKPGLETQGAPRPANLFSHNLHHGLLNDLSRSLQAFQSASPHWE